MKKAVVLRAKDSATMILECGALWLQPDCELVVEESLGKIVAGKYGLEEVRTCELDQEKWKMQKASGEPVKSKPKPESVEKGKQTKDLGSGTAKKKTRAKKVAKK